MKTLGQLQVSQKLGSNSIGALIDPRDVGNEIIGKAGVFIEVTRCGTILFQVYDSDIHRREFPGGRIDGPCLIQVGHPIGIGVSSCQLAIGVVNIIAMHIARDLGDIGHET